MAKPGVWLMGAAWSVLAAASAFAASELVVQQKDLAFIPEKVQIQAGDTLVFTNEDNYGHNMHSTSSGSEFDLGRQALYLPSRRVIRGVLPHPSEDAARGRR